MGASKIGADSDGLCPCVAKINLKCRCLSAISEPQIPLTTDYRPQTTDSLFPAWKRRAESCSPLRGKDQPKLPLS